MTQSERRELALSKGLCPRCFKRPHAERKVYCEYCTDQTGHWAADLKAEVIREYGGRCQCPGGCDVTEPRFLTVDHVNNDGAQHRKEVSGGSNIHRWLKRNGFPKKDYRLLCFNCNCGRRHGRCPHEA